MELKNRHACAKPDQRFKNSNVFVTFADPYLMANIEFRNKACTLGKYYSYTGVIFGAFIFMYVYRHIYVQVSSSIFPMSFLTPLYGLLLSVAPILRRTA